MGDIHIRNEDFERSENTHDDYDIYISVHNGSSKSVEAFICSNDTFC